MAGCLLHKPQTSFQTEECITTQPCWWLGVTAEFGISRERAQFVGVCVETVEKNIYTRG
jgi:hypothetical protein